MAQVGNDGHVDEVKEKLEPGGFALVCAAMELSVFEILLDSRTAVNDSQCGDFFIVLFDRFFRAIGPFDLCNGDGIMLSINTVSAPNWPKLLSR